MAGVGDDIDERGLVILLGNGGVVHALGHQGAGLDGAQGQAHGQADPLAGNGPLQKDGLSVQRVVAGDDDVGQVLAPGVVAALIGHSGHLGEGSFSDIRNQGWNAAHMDVPPRLMLSFAHSRGSVFLVRFYHICPAKSIPLRAFVKNF